MVHVEVHRYLAHAVAVERHDLGGEERQVRSSDVLEDRVREVEDRQLAVGRNLSAQAAAAAAEQHKTISFLAQA
ncbi:hypothetical protein ON010_g4733 [Phytophthora cinnamomi]|nr:hypothetical protein ON010_g4733 [Phytophthora cinnamomi]